MTPEQEEQVRRALAATAAGEGSQAMPPDVVARLDGVLEELTEPRRAAARPPEHRIDELEARRRRRWPHVLVAAAAVSVVGLAGGAVVTGRLTGSEPDSSSAGGASTAGDGARTAAGQGAPESLAPSQVPSQVPEAAGGDGTADQPGTALELRTATLDQDVERVLSTPRVFALRERGGSSPAQGQSSAEAAPVTCAVPATRRGDRLVAVRLDGRPATLLVGPLRQGARATAVYSCDRADTPVARTVVRP